MRFRSFFGCTGAVVLASLAFAAPAVASSTYRAGAAPRSISASSASAAATQHSPYFAGYVFPEPNAALNERATFVAPTLKCGKRNQGIGPSVGMNEETSGAATSASLLMVCTKGKTLNVAALTLNGNETNYRVKVHPGDRIALYATEGSTSGKVSFSDLTTKVKKTLTNSGTSGDAVTDPYIGDTAVFVGTSSRPLGVPNFGTIVFTGAKIFGEPLGRYPKPPLVKIDRYNSTDTILQIHTSGFSSPTSFKTLFKHS